MTAGLPSYATWRSQTGVKIRNSIEDLKGKLTTRTHTITVLEDDGVQIRERNCKSVTLVLYLGKVL